MGWVVMPVYEYECGECGHRFDLKRSVKGRNARALCERCYVASPQSRTIRACRRLVATVSGGKGFSMWKQVRGEFQ